MNSVQKIDIHSHVTAFPELTPTILATGHRIFSSEEQIALHHELNITHTVLLPIISPEGNCFTVSNEGCKILADKNPEHFSWFCNIDPRSVDNTATANLSHMLTFYKALGAKGVGEVTSNVYFDDPKADNMFSHCEACDMPVLFHVSPVLGGEYGMADEVGLYRLEKMLKKHPNLKFIGHSQPFWAEISADVTQESRNTYPEGKVVEGRLPYLMRTYSNLYCDLSAGSGANAMMRDPEYAVKFLNEFSDRIMYGCDVCGDVRPFYYNLDAFLDKLVEDGSLSMETYRKIVRENAIRILKLDLVP